MKLFLAIIISFVVMSCGFKSQNIEVDLADKYQKGIEYFDSEKYDKAKKEFDYIVMNNPGSKLALESQYYLGELLFNQEKYVKSSIEFDRYIRFSQDIKKIEYAQFKICECAVNSTFIYQKDQSTTLSAIDLMQGFIEEFPLSENVVKAQEKIAQLRNKLAQKDYESARLYLKLEEYESAEIYFKEVLSVFYDTEVADDARISIIFSLILQDEYEEAILYFNKNKDSFKSNDKLMIADKMLSNTKNGKLSSSEYIRLYK
jgi:outer membrane protein assembly factor BamD